MKSRAQSMWQFKRGVQVDDSMKEHKEHLEMQSR
jgi:hypothetical protein